MYRTIYNRLLQRGYYSLLHLFFLKLFLPYIERQNKKKFNAHDRSFVITGMPRGGTTWLGEILHQNIPNTIYFREPLKIGNIKELSILNFGWRQYIPENQEWEAAFDFFDRLFKGQIITPSLIDRYHYIPDLPHAEHLLFKFVRLNQALPWIVRNFPVLKPVYIIRHPCAVVYSQMNHQAWGYTRSLRFPYWYKAPETPFNSLQKKVEELLPKINTIEEHLAVDWCLDALPLFQPGNNRDWLTITYEEGVLDKETFIKRVFEWIEEPIPSDILKRMDRPSSSVQKGNPLLSPEDQLLKWQRQLSEDAIDRIMNIIEHFGITQYSRDPEPDYQSIKKYSENKILS